MSEEAFQITEKRREAKGKGERERYTQESAEFQRIARRGKKAFLNEQCKKKKINKKKTIEWERPHDQLSLLFMGVSIPFPDHQAEKY